ncbi:MAG: Re/Si-specific NAD(P)(+) transhydrogenase subunit alpha [Myxococcota bacterium]
MKIGVPLEVHPGERRVAATPDTVRKLVDQGFSVMVQSGAGNGASFPDEAYVSVGASIMTDAAELFGSSDLVLKVRPPTLEEADRLRSGAHVISFLWPAQSKALVDKLAEKGVSALAMDCVPRITRAQSVDALSSMAVIAGYRAVVEAATEFGSFFTPQMTAAGKVPAAKVLIIGAGVAGLAAIGAARGLGAVVRAFDTRPAVKEQVQSLGAEFLTVEIDESGEGAGGYAKEMSAAFLEAEMALFAQQCKEVDIIITTALIPGKPAPRLITREMVESMRPGSVVVDLAAEQGGNCEVTRPGERVEHHRVRVLGYTDMASRLATTASQMYGTNLVNLINMMGGGKAFTVNMEDEVIRGALVTHQGKVTWPPPPRQAPPPQPKPVTVPPPAAQPHAPVSPTRSPARRSWVYEAIGLAAISLWMYLMNTVKGEASAETLGLVQHVTVFMLACFVGWQVIWNVTPALHTPLMSVTNAISGIIIIGGMLQAHGGALSTPALVGTAAIFLATVNIAGGFWVTERMLRMFRK